MVADWNRIEFNSVIRLENHFAHTYSLYAQVSTRMWRKLWDTVHNGNSYLKLSNARTFSMNLFVTNRYNLQGNIRRKRCKLPEWLAVSGTLSEKRKLWITPEGWIYCCVMYENAACLAATTVNMIFRSLLYRSRSCKYGFLGCASTLPASTHTHTIHFD